MAKIHVCNVGILAGWAHKMNLITEETVTYRIVHRGKQA